MTVVFAVGFVSVAIGVAEARGGDTLAFLIITGIGMAWFGHVTWRQLRQRDRS